MLTYFNENIKQTTKGQAPFLGLISKQQLLVPVVDRCGGRKLNVSDNELATINFEQNFKSDQTCYPWLWVQVFGGYKSLYPYPYPGVTHDITHRYFDRSDLAPSYTDPPNGIGTNPQLA